MRRECCAGAGERDVDEVLLIAQATEGGDHGGMEVVPAQRVLLLGRGAACAHTVTAAVICDTRCAQRVPTFRYIANNSAL